MVCNIMYRAVPSGGGVGLVGQAGQLTPSPPPRDSQMFTLFVVVAENSHKYVCKGPLLLVDKSSLYSGSRRFSLLVSERCLV